jgi:hypothetical protein
VVCLHFLAGDDMIALDALLSVGEKLIDRFIPDPAQKAEAQMKLAQLAQDGELAKMANDAKLFETEVDDRKSARELQSATRSRMPAILAILVTIGFFGILYALMMGYAKPSNELMIMLGSLGTAWSGIIAYYFGSSAGSQAKTDALVKGYK